MKLWKSESEKVLVTVLGIFMLALLLYFVVLSGVEKSNEEKKTELTNLEQLKVENETKIAKVPIMNQEIEEITNRILPMTQRYYGKVPQEAFLYTLTWLSDESGVKFNGLSFSTANAEEYKQYMTSIEDYEYNFEENGEPFEIVMATFDFEGTFSQIEKLTRFVKDNNKRIVIKSMGINRKSELAPSLPNAYMTESELEASGFINTLSPESKETWDNLQILTGNMEMAFFSFDAVDDYLENNTVYMTGDRELNVTDDPNKKYVYEEFGLKASTENPFFTGRVDFLDTEKTLLYNFDTGSYLISTDGNANGSLGSDMVQYEGMDINVPTVTYDFTGTRPPTPEGEAGTELQGNLSNPDALKPLKAEVFIDLKDKNIQIADKNDVIGLELFSTDMNDVNMKIVVVDAANKPYVLNLSETMFWTGWATIYQSLGNISYPARVERIELSQDENTDKHEQGTLKLKSIYVGKHEQKVEEQQQPPAQTP